MIWVEPKRPHFFKRDEVFYLSSCLAARMEVRSYEAIQLTRIQWEGKGVCIRVNTQGDY